MDAREENVPFEILIFWRENRTSRSVEEDLPGTFLKNPISSVICHANGFLNLRYQRDCLNKSRLIQFSSFRRNFENFDLSSLRAKLFILSAIFQASLRYAILVPS